MADRILIVSVYTTVISLRVDYTDLYRLFLFQGQFLHSFGFTVGKEGINYN